MYRCTSSVADPTLPATASLDDDPGAQAVAGGTDLITLMRDGIRAPTRLVDINGLGLDRIEWRRDGSVRIGALCPNAVDERRLRAEFPVVVEALRSGASPQIRNMATFGGNILQQPRCPYFRLPEFACNKRNPGSGCSSIAGDSSKQAIFGASPECVAVHPSDLAVALQAVDAIVLVEGPRGARRIPMDQFELRKAELVVGVELPASRFARRSHYLKFRDRTSILANLEAKGLITRSTDLYHLNARNIELTEHGAKALAAADAAAVAIERKLGDEFTEDERETLIALLARCSTALHEQAAGVTGGRAALAPFRG
jgi:xanthine dehydrogenase YagS FAD-binding subunit